MKKEATQKLTAKQENQYRRFAQEYIIKFNGVEAAILAGYSKKTAASQASRLLTHVKVQAFIQEYISKREKRTGITADRVLEEIAKIAFLNADQFYNDDGTTKLLSEMDTDTRAALSSYSVKTIQIDGITEDIPIHRAHDKMKALEMAGKHLGMFTDRVEHSGQVEVKSGMGNLYKAINE